MKWKFKLMIKFHWEKLDMVLFSGTFGEKKVTVKKIQLIDTHNENEEIVMQNLNHPNIVKLFHIYRDIYDNYIG